MEHDRSRVLASVPGTDQAIEAVLVAQVPQTARVNKKELKAPDVAFQGDPQFTPIEQTKVERAFNTDKDVFKSSAKSSMPSLRPINSPIDPLQTDTKSLNPNLSAKSLPGWPRLLTSRPSGSLHNSFSHRQPGHRSLS
jgi:hypothetical protein